MGGLTEVGGGDPELILINLKSPERGKTHLFQYIYLDHLLSKILGAPVKM